MDPTNYSLSRWRAYKGFIAGSYILILDGAVRKALIATVPAKVNFFAGVKGLVYQLIMVNNYDSHTIDSCPEVSAGYSWDCSKDEVDIDDEENFEVRKDVLGLKPKLREVLGLPKDKIAGLEMLLTKLEEGKVAVPVQ